MLKMEIATHEKSMLRRKLRLLTLVGVLLALLLLSGVAALFVIDIEDVIYAKGKITSELSFRILSHIEGRVKKLHFDEGEDVKAGNVIAEIDPFDYEVTAAGIRSEIRESEAELEVRRAQLAALNCNPLPKELWYAETNVTECRDKARRTESRLERIRKLREINAISLKEFEDTEIENIKMQAEYLRSLKNLELVKSGLGARNIEKAERDIALVQAKIASRKDALEMVLRRIADCRIVSPADGRLVELPCKYTHYVKQGEPAALLSAGGIVKGVAYVDERLIRKVKEGLTVRVSSGVFNRLEYGSFDGRVSRIRDTPLEENGMTKYPVEVAIDPQGHPLRIGSSADFSIVAGREPVILSILGLSKENDVFPGEGKLRGEKNIHRTR